MTNDGDFLGPAERRKAGHQEILGETIAKFEFFQNGWHPYSRFLDVDKIDLILRRRIENAVIYREVQVKFGKLYPCETGWSQSLFTCTSWRFFSEKNIAALAKRTDIFLAYVLSPDGGFKGDMFLFPVLEFVDCVKCAVKLGNESYRVFISQSRSDPKRWYLRRKSKFSALTDDNVLDVTDYYRNFRCLNEA